MSTPRSAARRAVMAGSSRRSRIRVSGGSVLADRPPLPAGNHLRPGLNEALEGLLAEVVPLPQGPDFVRREQSVLLPRDLRRAPLHVAHLTRRQ
jgi:hypothetical protein